MIGSIVFVIVLQMFTRTPSRVYADMNGQLTPINNNAGFNPYGGPGGMQGNPYMNNQGYGNYGTGPYDMNYRNSNYQGAQAYSNYQQQYQQQPYHPSYRYSQTGNYPNTHMQNNYATTHNDN